MIDRIAAALDAVRAALLRKLLAHRPLRALFVDRRRRMIAWGMLAVTFALFTALRAPLLSLWLGAALFGVPHVASGVRVVAVRQRVARPTLLLVALAVGVGIAQIVGSDGPWSSRAFALLFGLAIVSELFALRIIALCVCAAILCAVAAAWRFPNEFLVIASHLHGIASVGYLVVRCHRRSVSIAPVWIAAATITVAGAAGLFDPLFAKTLWAPHSAAHSIALEAIGSTLGASNRVLLHRGLFLYAFGQSLHFSVWLRLIPEIDRPRAVPHTFRRTLRLLRADFGRLTTPLLVVCALSPLAIVLGGGTAREVYFALTYFHVGLEAAALAGQFSVRRPVVQLAPLHQLQHLGALAAPLDTLARSRRETDARRAA